MAETRTPNAEPIAQSERAIEQDNEKAASSERKGISQTVVPDLPTEHYRVLCYLCCFAKDFEIIGEILGGHWEEFDVTQKSPNYSMFSQIVTKDYPPKYQAIHFLSVIGPSIIN